MLSIRRLPVILILFAPALSAEQSGDTPTFELASVKANGSGDPGGSMRTTPGGRFEATNTTLRTLLRYAYNVRDFQIEAAPAWFDSLRYDIVGKAPASASTAEFRLMVQKLLAQRFALVLRRETKAVPAYALKAGKRGPNMKPNTEGDTSFVSGQTEIRAQKITMRMLANQLSMALGRPVIDKTELMGTFDVTLQWGPDTVTEGPSIFAAVQEQLGLKLDADKAPVEVLIVESANRTPVEN